jgi:hypothetical protein
LNGLEYRIEHIGNSRLNLERRLTNMEYPACQKRSITKELWDELFSSVEEILLNQLC